MNNKKLVAEAFGTYTLTLVVILSSLHTFPLPTSVLAGLTLLLFVYSIGSISGAHINPAVTIGLLTLGKIKRSEALFYIISQLLGGFGAMLTLNYLGLSVKPLQSSVWSIGLAEALGGVIFTFGIASVVFAKAHEASSGVIIGGSLLLGIAVSQLLGGPGLLNPAVALGLGSFSFMTVLGPVVGSLIGMNLYRFLISREKTKK